MLKDLGERLKLARKRRRMTALQMAERLGVSRETLRRLENGSATTAVGTLVQALRILGLAEDFARLAAQDHLGRSLQDAELLSPGDQR